MRKCWRNGIFVALLSMATPAWAAGKPAPGLDVPLAAQLAQLALDCVHVEYPNKIAHTLKADADVGTPRQLYPAFYGCYDWHSAVHGHWLLVRLVQLYPDAPFAADARASLAQSLTDDNIRGELAYFARGDLGFERPYGLAWLLQLGAQLRASKDPQMQAWAKTLAPLEEVAMQRVMTWLPKLTRPVRVGEHSQTAFAFGLMLDWARQTGHKEFEALLVQRSRDFHFNDRDCPLAYEPSGQDFLSPCIAEADLMRRVLAPKDFQSWLDRFLPHIPRHKADANWLKPGVVLDKTDGKLAHLDGLNLSRAWMLEGIVRGLPKGDNRIPALKAAAAIHREAGLASLHDMHYMGSHWLGTFATYMVAPPGA